MTGLKNVNNGGKGMADNNVTKDAFDERENNDNNKENKEKKGGFLDFLGGLGLSGGVEEGVPEEEQVSSPQGAEEHTSPPVDDGIGNGNRENAENSVARDDVEKGVEEKVEAPLAEPAMEEVTPASESSVSDERVAAEPAPEPTPAPAASKPAAAAQPAREAQKILEDVFSVASELDDEVYKYVDFSALKGGSSDEKSAPQQPVAAPEKPAPTAAPTPKATPVPEPVVSPEAAEEPEPTPEIISESAPEAAEPVTKQRSVAEPAVVSAPVVEQAVTPSGGQRQPG
ncbi:MAG: hypothetical protein ACTJLL_04885 [Anaplasma sp.]